MNLFTTIYFNDDFKLKSKVISYDVICCSYDVLCCSQALKALSVFTQQRHGATSSLAGKMATLFTFITGEIASAESSVFVGSSAAALSALEFTQFVDCDAVSTLLRANGLST